MKNIMLAFAVVTAFMSFGCKRKGDGTGDPMAKAIEFKDEMCKCKDAKCAQDVTDTMIRWSQEMQKASTEPPKGKTAAAVLEELGNCKTSAMGAGATPPAGG